MSTAIALATEFSAPGGGDLDVLNDLLRDVPHDQMPAVTAAMAILAATFANGWSTYEPAEPAELLRCIGQVAIERGT
jgi:hypothetical protein